MSLSQKITSFWTRVSRPAPTKQLEPTSYGVIVRSDTSAADMTNPLFVAQAQIVADKIVEALKSAGLKDEAVQVTIGTLPTVEAPYGVRFEADAAAAQTVANLLPNHVVVRSDCRVICPQQGRGKTKPCEID